MTLLEDLQSLKSEVEALNDGTSDRIDICNNMCGALTLELSCPDEIESRETIRLTRKKLNFILNTNWDQSNMLLNQALLDEPPDTLKSTL